MIKYRFLFMLAALLLSLGISAETLSLPRFFSDGMVLQRGAKVPVWGRADAGSTIRVEFAGKSAKTVVAADGTWKVYLPKMQAISTPQQMHIMQKAAGEKQFAEAKVISNILVGDVFLCSGQSNMELPIRRCMDKVADMVKDYSNANIRYLKFPHQYNYVRPNDDVRILPWQDITPENCAEVSGICYFMARHLQEEKNVPIGIINSAVGGTRVESWMPQQVLEQFPAYANEFTQLKYNQLNWPDSVNRAEMKASHEWDVKAIALDNVVNQWRKSDYDFSKWTTVDIFSNWSEGKNGSYWFRKTLTLSASQSGQAATIRVGAMKDADSVFVNGKFVGNTTYEYPPRIYKIPAGVLREGENEVVVHLMSYSGHPNFTSGKLYQLEIGNDIVPLGNEWQMTRGSEMHRKPSSTYFVDCPTGLYNAMIAPLQNFALSGILWYQGESNQGNTGVYADYLEAMVKSWRTQFKKELPVVIMQLPGYMSRHKEPIKNSGWCEIREQQRLAALRIPKAGLAPTLDTGEWNDIHPQDKHVAGERAALLMRHLVYGEKNLVCEGPKAVSAKRQADGSIIVTFDDGQTKTVTKSTVTWSILPDKNILRYCYDDYPEPEIFGSTGIPAPQFEIEIK